MSSKFSSKDMTANDIKISRMPLLNLSHVHVRVLINIFFISSLYTWKKPCSSEISLNAFFINETFSSHL